MGGAHPTKRSLAVPEDLAAEVRDQLTVALEQQGPGVVDVTDHPSVTALALASDVAVLDYSSLRFDYALTNRPMIFFVPDRAAYFASREPMIPFDGTAPGPWAETTEEVIDVLRDVGRLESDFRDDRNQFKARFMELEDGQAAARLVDQVFVPRGDAPPSWTHMS